MPMSLGWNSASGTMNRSLFTDNTCSVPARDQYLDQALDVRGTDCPIFERR